MASTWNLVNTDSEQTRLLRTRQIWEFLLGLSHLRDNKTAIASSPVIGRRLRGTDQVPGTDLEGTRLRQPVNGVSIWITRDGGEKWSGTDLERLCAIYQR